MTSGYLRIGVVSRIDFFVDEEFLAGFIVLLFTLVLFEHIDELGANAVQLFAQGLKLGPEAVGVLLDDFVLALGTTS